MLTRFLDAIFYEKRFNRWLDTFNFPSLLVGNRAAAAYHLSPSLGCSYDVELLQTLYLEKYPQALHWGRKHGRPTKNAAFNFLCDIFDTYASFETQSDVTDAFVISVGYAAWSTGIMPGRHWQDAIEAHRVKRTKEDKEQAARMPEIIEARQIGNAQYIQVSEALERGELPTEAINVWRALNKDSATEWQIAQKSGVPLEVVCAWLPVFMAYNLVVVIGTALREPLYHTSPFARNDPKAQSILFQLTAAD